jgi:two-component system response regulator YesN
VNSEFSRLPIYSRDTFSMAEKVLRALQPRVIAEAESWDLSEKDYMEKNEKIEVALRYIRANLESADLSVTTASREASLSQSRFIHIFKEVMGVPFSDFVTANRVERAKALLSTSTGKIADICYAVGYENPSYFSALFKKQTGVSPGEFRKTRKGA